MKSSLSIGGMKFTFLLWYMLGVSCRMHCANYGDRLYSIEGHNFITDLIFTTFWPQLCYVFSANLNI